MADGIIYHLETIYIKTDDGDPISAGARIVDHLVEMLARHDPVRQPRQRIVIGQKFYERLRILYLGDIDYYRDIIAYVSAFIHAQGHGFHHRRDIPIFPSVPHLTRPKAVLP